MVRDGKMRGKIAKPYGTSDSRAADSQVGKASVSLYNEDCVAGMQRRLKPRSVDVVVTSPPYNLGIKYGTYVDSGSRSEYLSWLGRFAIALKEVLADEGSFFLNIGSKPSDPWVPFEVASEMRKHFELQNVIHWVKSIAIDKDAVGDYDVLKGDASFGHFKPINSPRFLNDCHEFIFHFTKTGGVPLDRLAIGVGYQDKSNVRRWKGAGNDVRCRGNTWFVPYETIQSRDKDRPHPATFPVELARKCILLHGKERTRLVLDPFLGIGNAGLAAASLQKDFAGFEIDKDYFGTAEAAIRGPKGDL